MSREDIIFYANISSGLGTPVSIILALFLNRPAPIKGEAQTAGMPFGDIPKTITSKVFWMLAVALYLIFVASMILRTGQAGPAGPAGPSGPPGPPAPQDDLPAKVNAMQSQIASLKKEVSDSFEGAILVRSYIKAGDCKNILKKTLDDVQASYDAVQGFKIEGTAPALRGELSGSFPFMLQKSYDDVKTCFSDTVVPKTEIGEEALESSVEGEPSGDPDKAKKFRRRYIAFNRAKGVLQTAISRANADESRLKGKIDSRDAN